MPAKVRSVSPRPRPSWDICVGAMVMFLTIPFGMMSCDAQRSSGTDDPGASAPPVAADEDESASSGGNDAAPTPDRASDEGSDDLAREPIVPVPGAPTSFADLVEEVTPGVVNISTRQVRRVRAPALQHPYYFGHPHLGVPETQIGESLGTGFIVDVEGHILTNSHVIDGASEIRVNIYGGREVEAVVVGIDPLTDIALLRIEPFEGISPVRMGNSDTARVGDWVIAVGNPFGLQSTVTAGIISARGRRNVPLSGSIRYIDFLQTDASINPGNSGGPLVNMRGEVVGINTAVNREGQGIGFAIPVNMSYPVLAQLKERGRVSRSWLGVYIAEVDRDVALINNMSEARGALVTRTVSGGPADIAGLQAGDVILRFGDTEVAQSDQLMWIASSAGVGERVHVEVSRGGTRLSLPVVLGELPD